MLNVVVSNSIYSARSLILEKMQANRAHANTQIVVVPDRFGMSAERDILHELGIKGSFDIIVTSFMKLAKRVLGNVADDSMSAEGAVMLLYRAITKVRYKLSVYKRVSNKAGFIPELYAVIANIRRNCYSVDDLRAVIPKLPQYVKSKCSDILAVYEQYVKELDEGKMDGSTLLERLATAIPESDFISRADVYFLDFFSYTGEQKRVIKALIKYANSVTTYNLKGYGDNSRIYDTRDVDELIRIAKTERVKVEETSLPNTLQEGRKLVADRLFSYKRLDKVRGGEGIKIYEAESIDGEVEHLARTILMLTKEGYRYRDISVLSGSDNIIPTIKRIFARHDIPVFTDEKTLLINTPIAKFYQGATKLKKRSDVGECISLIKNPYSRVEKCDIQDFQNHCLAYSIERLNLEKPIPLGVDATTYLGAEKARRVLLNLLKDRQNSLSAREYAIQSQDFLDEVGARETYQKESKKMISHADYYADARDRQAIDKLYKVFDQVIKIMGDTPLTIDEYDGIVQVALNTVGISYAPIFVDTVYVGGAEKSRFSDCKVFCIIGAETGSLPRYSKKVGILGEAEEKALKRHNFDLQPTALRSSKEEMLHVTQLLIMQKERMFISYTPSISSSELVDEIKAIFSDLTVNNPYNLYKTDAEWIAYYAPTRSACLYSYTYKCAEQYSQVFKRALGIDSSVEEECKIDRADKLFFPKATTSVSQLTTYFTCPYKHFFEYGLRARNIVKPNNPMVAGNFLHAVLEKGLQEISKAGYPSVDSQQYEDIVSGVISKIENMEEYSSFKNEGWAQTLRRLVEEGKKALKSVVERVSVAKYKPANFEYVFGQDKPFCIEGENISLRLVGKIDRIDTFEDKAILLDYKTGKAHGTIKDLYYGVGVQLVLYMSALDETGIKTTGAFYYPIQDGYTGDKPRLKGNILTNELPNFDGKWAWGKTSDYIEVDYDATLKPSIDTQDAILKDGELQALKDYSKSVCAKAVDEMSAGYIAKSPIDKSKCEWCRWKPLCQNAIARHTSTIRKDAISKGEQDEQLD